MANIRKIEIRPQVNGSFDDTILYPKTSASQVVVNDETDVRLTDFLSTLNPDYAVCDTLGSEVEKVVLLDGFTLKEGTRISIKFTNVNTVGNPLIKINNNEAYPIVKTDSKPFFNLREDGIYTFMFSGSAFMLQGESEVSGGSDDTGESDGSLFEGLVKPSATFSYAYDKLRNEDTFDYLEPVYVDKYTGRVSKVNKKPKLNFLNSGTLTHPSNFKPIVSTYQSSMENPRMSSVAVSENAIVTSYFKIITGGNNKTSMINPHVSFTLVDNETGAGVIVREVCLNFAYGQYFTIRTIATSDPRVVLVFTSNLSTKVLEIYKVTINEDYTDIEDTKLSFSLNRYSNFRLTNSYLDDHFILIASYYEGVTSANEGKHNVMTFKYDKVTKEVVLLHQIVNLYNVAPSNHMSNFNVDRIVDTEFGYVYTMYDNANLRVISFNYDVSTGSLTSLIVMFNGSSNQYVHQIKSIAPEIFLMSTVASANTGSIFNENFYVLKKTTSGYVQSNINFYQYLKTSTQNYGIIKYNFEVLDYDSSNQVVTIALAGDISSSNVNSYVVNNASVFIVKINLNALQYVNYAVTTPLSTTDPFSTSAITRHGNFVLFGNQLKYVCCGNMPDKFADSIEGNLRIASYDYKLTERIDGFVLTDNVTGSVEVLQNGFIDISLESPILGGVVYYDTITGKFNQNKLGVKVGFLYTKNKAYIKLYKEGGMR